MITFKNFNPTLSEIYSSFDEEDLENNLSEQSLTMSVNTSKSKSEDHSKCPDNRTFSRPLSIINVKTEKTEIEQKTRNFRIKHVEFSYPITFETLYDYGFDKIKQFENYFTCYNRDSVIKILSKPKDTDEKKKRKKKKGFIF